MIVGFLGKGGSGKSTVSAAFCEHLFSQDKKVLAIDADHNMDLLYNLHVKEKPKWLGESMQDLLSHGGIEEGAGNYRNLFDIHPKPEFRLTPPDSYTEKYSRQVRSHLWVMAGGPHTDQVLHDKACSHVLTTPLKVLLPFFQLQKDEFIVVDEKAGSDGAGTGIASGLDLGVIVLEPSPHGVKAACQIAELLEFFETPYCFIINKLVADKALERVQRLLPRQPLMNIRFNDAIGWCDIEEDTETISTTPQWDFSPVIDFIKSLNTEDEVGETYRYKRALERMNRNRNYAAA